MTVAAIYQPFLPELGLLGKTLVICLTIKQMISNMREDPENILEHRHEAIVYGVSDIYKNQVLEMADILENGLSKYKHQKTIKDEKEIPKKDTRPLVASNTLANTLDVEGTDFSE